MRVCEGGLECHLSLGRVCGDVRVRIAFLKSEVQLKPLYAEKLQKSSGVPGEGLCKAFSPPTLVLMA